MAGEISILEFLTDKDEPVTPQEIALGTGMVRNNVDQLLFKMVKEGEVLKAGRGRYIHPSKKDGSIYPPIKGIRR
jgi:DNA-binding IclR family transcriptional regulator